MNTKTQLVLSIAAIVIIMTVSYIVFPGTNKRIYNNVQDIQEEVNLGEETYPGYEEQLFQEGSLDSTYIIEFEYPKIQELENEENQRIVNEKLEEYILLIIEDFKKQALEMEIIEDIGHGLYGGYEVLTINGSLVSIKFVVSEYFSTAAHPNSYVHMFNYNMENNSFITLEDVFLEDSDYLNFISAQTIDEFTNRFVENQEMEDSLKGGAAPELNNYKNFGFSENSLIFYFDPYQVAAYALGIQEIGLPYTDLIDYINPEGPVGKII